MCDNKLCDKKMCDKKMCDKSDKMRSCLDGQVVVGESLPCWTCYVEWGGRVHQLSVISGKGNSEVLHIDGKGKGHCFSSHSFSESWKLLSNHSRKMRRKTGLRLGCLNHQMNCSSERYTRRVPRLRYDTLNFLGINTTVWRIEWTHGDTLLWDASRQVRCRL